MIRSNKNLGWTKTVLVRGIFEDLNIKDLEPNLLDGEKQC